VTVEVIEDVSADDLVDASAVEKIDAAPLQVIRVEFDSRRLVILLPKEGFKIRKKTKSHGT